MPTPRPLRVGVGGGSVVPFISKLHGDTKMYNFIYIHKKDEAFLDQLWQTPKCAAAMRHFRLTARCK